MPTVEAVPSPFILNQAERELGAFLLAVTGLVGSEGLSGACDLWIKTLRAAECPDSEQPSFFRSVTIHTIAQLAGNPINAPFDHHNNWMPPAAEKGDSPLEICA